MIKEKQYDEIIKYYISENINCKGYEIRAYGFSKCSNYIVIGNSADLIIFKRVYKKIVK